MYSLGCLDDPHARAKAVLSAENDAILLFTRRCHHGAANAKDRASPRTSAGAKATGEREMCKHQTRHRLDGDLLLESRFRISLE